MERLPKETLLNAIDTYKTVIEAVDGKDTDYCPVLDKVTVTLLEELKAYRDAEEQGLILRLPCKVGDTVYTVDYYYDCDCDYECIEIDSYKCEEDLPCEHQYKVYRVKEIKFQEQMLVVVGKSVFLTKEEAEQKLEEMKEK